MIKEYKPSLIKRIVEIRSLQAKLLSWYHQNKRDLPWRQTNDPYKIWVSEIMLQQTQVITVVDYYHRFLKKFPTIEALAEASEEEVLALWSGLGYYSRARNLQQAAKKIQSDYNGKFPISPEQIQSLPGIGRYTLGAIASIAFKLPLPLVDGNVIRVYSRLFAWAESPSDRSFQKKIWETAEVLLDQQNPGDFNQALMELGATVCLPKNPLCLFCPLQSLCLGFKEGVEKFPQKKEAPQTVQLYRLAFILKENNNLLLIRNHESRWHKKLWGLPGPALFEEKKKLDEYLQSFMKEVNIDSSEVIFHPPLTHFITHHKIKVFPCTVPSTKKEKISKESLETKWIPLEKTEELGIPSVDRKIIKNHA